MLPFTAANDPAEGAQERETLPPPTVPAPRTSEVRIRTSRLHEVVDLVTADLQLDPRSEDFIGGPEQVPTPRPRMALPPKPIYSLPAGPRDLPHAPRASDTYFTKPQSSLDARHLPSIRVRLTKRPLKKIAGSKKYA